MMKVAENMIEAVFGYTQEDLLMGRRRRVRLMKRNADPWGRAFESPLYAVLENNHIVFQFKSLGEATQAYNDYVKKLR